MMEMKRTPNRENMMGEDIHVLFSGYADTDKGIALTRISVFEAA